MSFMKMAVAARVASRATETASKRMNQAASNMTKQIDAISRRSTGFYTGLTLLQQLNDLLDRQKAIVSGKGEKGIGSASYNELQRQIMEILNAINKFLVGTNGPRFDLTSYTAYHNSQGSSSYGDAQSTGELP